MLGFLLMRFTPMDTLIENKGILLPALDFMIQCLLEIEQPLLYHKQSINGSVLSRLFSAHINQQIREEDVNIINLSSMYS